MVNGGNDWRGFAWAPLTPDGKYIFATNNIYGNTNQTVVGINTTTREVELPAAVISGGIGTGLRADYFPNTTWTGNAWRRIDAQPNFDWLASPGGPIPADGFSVAWNGNVEGLFTEATTFEVEASAGVRLTVGGNVIIDQLANSLGTATTKFTGVANLTRGQQTSIRLEAVDMSSETIVKLRWSSASTPYGFIPQSQLFPSGGPYGAVARYTDTTGHAITRLESDLYYNWGSLSPSKGITSGSLDNIDADKFTVDWNALVEAPATGNLQWCVQSDEGVVVDIDGVNKFNTAAATNTCATAMAVTAGQKYAVHVKHTDVSGNAFMLMTWKMDTFITLKSPFRWRGRSRPPPGPRLPTVFRRRSTTRWTTATPWSA